MGRVVQIVIRDDKIFIYGDKEVVKKVVKKLKKQGVLVDVLVESMCG